MRSVRIIYPDVGLGLANDALILARLLRRAGIEAVVIPLPVSYRGSLPLRAAGRAVRRLAPRSAAAFFTAGVRIARYGTLQRADINIFLQRVFHTLVPTARRNVLIPNPEWFNAEWEWHLELVDAVWCKTRDALELLGSRCRTAEYIGFTSADRKAPGQGGSSAAGWLHIASAGVQKGTEAVIEAWRRNPQWPSVTILQHRRAALGCSNGNIRYIAKRVSERELLSLLNSAAFHLCPSEVEGFGHSIVEAMSCGALVLSTGAPPMNELVQEDRGVLIDAGQAAPQRLGRRYRVTPQAVERAVQRVFAMEASQIARRRQAARAWFEENQSRFETRLRNAVEMLCGP